MKIPDGKVLAELQKLRKNCPLLHKAIHQRRWLVPQFRQAQYCNQDLLNADFERSMLSLGSVGLRTDNDGINLQLLNMVAALNYERPTFYLEHELGRLLEHGELRDMNSEDIKWRFPQLRIMMPKGICTLKRDGREYDIFYIDLARLDLHEVITLNTPIANELDHYVSRAYPRDEERGTIVTEYVFQSNGAHHLDLVGAGEISLRDIAFRCEDPGVAISAMVEPGMNYSQIMPWGQGATLTQLLQSYDTSDALHGGEQLDDIDHEFLRRLRKLVFHILLFFSAYPIEYQPNTFVRVPRQEGKHFKAGLIKAHFMGASQLRPLRPSRPKVGEAEPTGRTYPPHWVSEFWRRQPYGPKSTLRRLQWVWPYHTGTLEEE